MSTKTTADRLSRLAESQLQLQGSRSAVLEAGALGALSADAAFAISAVNTGAADLWILALTLLGLSLTFAVRTLRLPGAQEAGPSLRDMREARGTQDDIELEEWLLNDLTDDIDTNEQNLTRKATLFDRALIFLLLGIVIELTGRL